MLYETMVVDEGTAVLFTTAEELAVVVGQAVAPVPHAVAVVQSEWLNQEWTPAPQTAAESVAVAHALELSLMAALLVVAVAEALEEDET